MGQTAELLKQDIEELKKRKWRGWLADKFASAAAIIITGMVCLYFGWIGKTILEIQRWQELRDLESKILKNEILEAINQTHTEPALPGHEEKPRDLKKDLFEHSSRIYEQRQMK